MDEPKKKRSLALRVTNGSNLKDDEMTFITKDSKKYLTRGKDSSRNENYNKIKGAEKQVSDGIVKCGKHDHMIKNYLM